uniref:ATP synthase complex subunit 8 n=1 Tax=Phyllomimus detersus TaxID=948396 RepID=A0A0N9LHB2_9ORTH|nr:ATP synthase F0 subunit 8 [Phyllomimus detersus]ALG66354.1 ATP synthase F0 subunit 8 [Phyllomimus detersus]
MPQMSPLNWTNLFLMFSILLMLFIIMNYTNTSINPFKSQTIMPNYVNTVNWKW